MRSRRSYYRLDPQSAHRFTHAPRDARNRMARDLVRETEHTPSASRSVVAVHMGFSSACARAVGIMHLIAATGRRFVSWDVSASRSNDMAITSRLTEGVRTALTSAGLPLVDDCAWEVPRQ